MTVSFSNISSDIRVPLFYVEVDNSMANSATDTQRTLLIGQMTAGGTATAKTAYRCTSASTAAGLCGAGSVLHTMLAKYLANDSSGETWILPLADDSKTMTAATGSISVGGGTDNIGGHFAVHCRYPNQADSETNVHKD